MADYTLSVKVTADAGQFNDAMDGVKEKTEQAASATDVFKGAFLANLASNAVISGLGAVKNAIGGIVDGVKSLVSASISGQAELEQNLGGSEAVFEQYAETVKQKAKTAYRDMGASASDYLATANKMGALFQGSGVSVEKSMDLSVRAMQRAADAASVMGIDTAAALEAVTGAAKGNYTMMDNLGVAMNVTKMEAYASSLNKVWKEMSSAEQAELAMQYFFENTEKYAGNFEREAVGSISGSFGALKSAWGDLVTGLASPDADLGQMTDNVVEAFENVVTNLVPVADRLVQTIPELITRIGPVIMEKAPELLSKGKELMMQFFEGIRTAFGEFDITALITDLLYALLPQETADKIITFFSDIFKTVSDMDWETIASAVGKVAEGVGKLVEFISQHGSEVASILGVIIGIGIAGEIISIVKGISLLIGAIGTFNPIVALVTAGIVALLYVMTHWQQVSEKAKEIWSKVTEVVGEKWEQLKEKLSQVWDAIKNAAKPAWELIKTVILGPVLLLCDLVTGDFDKLKEDAGKIWDKLKENVDKIVGKLQETVGAKFDELKEIVPQKIGEMKDKAVQTVTDLKDAFFEEIQKIISDAPQWGEDIIQGIIDGITGGISYVQGAVSDVAQGIRDFIGFSEPDKGPLSDFHTYMPDMINLMASGITRGLPALRDAANQAAGVLAGSLDMTSGLRGQQLAFAGAGNSSISYGGVNVNVYGAEGQDVEALADIVSDRIIELARREA